MIRRILQIIQHIFVALLGPVKICLLSGDLIQLAAQYRSRTCRAGMFAGSVTVQLSPVYSATASIVPSISDKVVPYGFCLIEETQIFCLHIPVHHINADPYVVVIVPVISFGRIAGVCPLAVVVLEKVLYALVHHLIHRCVEIFHFALTARLTHSHESRQTASLTPDQSIAVPVFTTGIRVPGAPATA